MAIQVLITEPGINMLSNSENDTSVLIGPRGNETITTNVSMNKGFF